ncbi:heat-shock protein [Pedobacter yulinensis]|uniref:Heat-shock protein n=1 Tax=Pedobacter yulinensis TaxID=2126353 RepID=A0A2T3HN19_9SPHI|nr:Hsp20/alpha crystallin family protein [Pedobacter yulinensis]PST83781.1 heat-shock protein [Pedobacter yulinensis]
MTLVKFNNRTRNHVPYLNNVFDSLFSDAMIKTDRVARQPQVNISETEHDFRLDLAAPGLKKENFEVAVKDNTLSITAARKQEQTQEVKNYSRKEFEYSEFARSFNLPEIADSEQINAVYTDGILHVTIAKKQEVKPQKRAIEVA